MRNFTRGWLVGGLALALAGCGLAPSLGTAPASRLAAQDYDLSQNDSPRESFTVPKHALAAPQPWQSNSSATLTVGPSENVALIEDVIQSAKKTCFIEVFNFANDSFGQRIAPLAIAAAKRGVKVYFLVDYVGSRFVGGKTLGKEMAEAGVEFRMWMPRFITQDDRHRGINITHRKLYLADGIRGVTGGVNLQSPFDTTTHDVLVDFRGEEAEQLHLEFQRDWKNAKGGDLQWDALPAGVTFGSVNARTLVTSPVEGRFEARAAIQEAIDGAQSEILIEQQYLWDDKVMKGLVNAAKRGVAIRVIVPGKSDSFKALHATALNTIMQAGGQCRLYSGNPDTAHVHTKYFSFDNRWAVFGSVNGDTRALSDNQELDVATTDPGLIAALRNRMFEVDWNTASVVFHFEDEPYFDGPFTKLWQLIKYYT